MVINLPESIEAQIMMPVTPSPSRVQCRLVCRKYRPSSISVRLFEERFSSAKMEVNVNYAALNRKGVE